MIYFLTGLYFVWIVGPYYNNANWSLRMLLLVPPPFAQALKSFSDGEGLLLSLEQFGALFVFCIAAAEVVVLFKRRA
jgi:hypothetical protein